MNKAKWAVLAALLVALASFIGGRFYGREKERQRGFSEGYAEGYAAPHPADTMFTTDTIREPYPVPSSLAPAGYELAPVGTLAELRAQVDSLASAAHDTTEIYVPVQIERAEFVKPDYHLIISGWHPRVELIEVFAQTETIINYIDRPVPVGRPVPYRWALSSRTTEQEARLAELDKTFSRYKALEGEMLKEEVKLDCVPMPYEDFHALQKENEKTCPALAHGYIEDVLEGVLWTAPED